MRDGTELCCRIGIALVGVGEENIPGMIGLFLLLWVLIASEIINLPMPDVRSGVCGREWGKGAKVIVLSAIWGVWESGACGEKAKMLLIALIIFSV